MGAFLTLEELVAEEVARSSKASSEGGLMPASCASGARGIGAPGKTRVFDLHCDTIARLATMDDARILPDFAAHDAALPPGHMRSLGSNAAQVSLERMRAFNWCQCFAAFVSDEFHGDEAWLVLSRLRQRFERELEKNEEYMQRVATAADIETAFESGKTAAMLTVEGASFLEDDSHVEARLDALVEAGVRMVTLTWNARNALGSGNETTDGLTAFGRTVVRELEHRSIVVDVSHLNERGFRDMCTVAQKPFAASHSNARAMCDHPRNLADWQLREIADRGGIVGLNFCRQFITDKHLDPTTDDVLRHVDHILEVAGEDVLALGSDYDGCDVPSWLNPCDKIGNLHQLLVKQFGQEITDRIFFENAYGFFR